MTLSTEESHTTEESHALAGCIEACERCARVAREVGDSAFAATGPGQSSVGAHLRHTLEHLQGFLEGLASGTVRYDARKRDTKFETDPDYFLAVLEDLTAKLRDVPAASVHAPLTVCQIARDSGEEVTMQSTVERELMFLSGHAIHHLALIDLILRSSGIKIESALATAFSTAAYRRATG